VKTQTEDGMSGFHYYLNTGTTKTTELLAVRSGRTLPPRKFLGTYFCLRLLNAEGRNTSVENFQGPFRESNPEPPVVI